MTTNVLELRHFTRSFAERGQADVRPVRTGADILPAAEQLAREAHRRGLRMMVWHDLATLAPMQDGAGNLVNAVAFGWSEPELAGWQSRDRALRSPLLRAARVASAPLWITRRAIRSTAANRLLDQIDPRDLDHCPLARPAIVIPVHMALGQVGAAFLTSIDPACQDPAVAFEACTRDLAAPVTHFITDAAGLIRDERYLPANSLLSSREIECLSWVAHGKTDHEISIILGRSHAGVRYHVTRACAKLDAVNRAQSVFRAAQLGYLGIPAPAAPGSSNN